MSKQKKKNLNPLKILNLNQQLINYTIQKFLIRIHNCLCKIALL